MKKLALTLVLMMLLAACGDSGATTQAPAATNAPAAATEGTVAATK